MSRDNSSKRMWNKEPLNQSKMKTKVAEAKKAETVRVPPRMHPVVESKQRSIVILWGLINIKF